MPPKPGRFGELFERFPLVDAFRDRNLVCAARASYDDTFLLTMQAPGNIDVLQ